jgi:hypothetical protein
VARVGGDKMLLIDETKLTIGTLCMIGLDYNIKFEKECEKFYQEYEEYANEVIETLKYKGDI